MPNSGLLTVLAAQLRDKSGSVRSKRISTRNLRARSKSYCLLSTTRLLRKSRRMRMKMRVSLMLGKRNNNNLAVTSYLSPSHRLLTTRVVLLKTEASNIIILILMKLRNNSRSGSAKSTYSSFLVGLRFYWRRLFNYFFLSQVFTKTVLLEWFFYLEFSCI